MADNTRRTRQQLRELERQRQEAISSGAAENSPAVQRLDEQIEALKLKIKQLRKRQPGH